MVTQSSLQGRTARALALSKRDTTDGATLVEAEAPFFHFDPVFVERGIADLVLPPPCPAWNRSRNRHSTHLRVARNATVFGPNYVVDSDGRCHSESLQFRRGPLQFYDKTLRHSYPGNNPEIVFKDDHAEIFWSSSSSQNIIELHEPIILVTPFEPNNWGRWVSHVIPKLTHITKLGLTEKILVVYQSSWQKRLLEIFGFGQNRVIAHNPGLTYRAPSVTSFHQSSTDFTVSYDEFGIYQNIKSRFDHKDKTPKKLFISRLTMSQKRPGYRNLINENELLGALKHDGFVAFEPELFSFEEQVRWFSGADVVVGLGGAGMFNTVFCNSQAKVVTIEASPTFITSHTGIFASLGLWHGVIYGKPVDPSTGGAHANWQVDPSAIIDSLATHKLMRMPS